MKKERLLYFESLRGIAALTVALYHFQTTSSSWLTDNAFVLNGRTMVDFFFVLSGFVICYTYSNRIIDAKSFVGFQIKRFLRLYPLHFIMLIVFLLIETSKFIFEQKTGISPSQPPFSNNDTTAFIHNIFLTQILVSELNFNGPSWSISTEFYTYLIFGTIILLVKEKNIWLIMLFLIISSVSGIILFITDGIYEESGLVAMARCTYSFFIGAITFYICQKISFKTSVWILIFLFLLIIFSVSYPEKIPGLILPLLFGLLMISLFTSGDNFVKKVLNMPYLVYLGTISYGIYMIHFAVWWFLNQTLRFIFKIGLSPSSNDITDLAIDPITSTFLAMFGIIIIIILASLSYKYIETPFNKIRNKN